MRTLARASTPEAAHSSSKHARIAQSGKYKEPGCVDGKGEEARFNQPCGLALSDDGSVCMIADCNNHVLRRLVLKDLCVETIAGKAGEVGHADGSGDVARFKNPSDLVVDAAGVVTVVRMCWRAFLLSMPCCCRGTCTYVAASALSVLAARVIAHLFLLCCGVPCYGFRIACAWPVCVCARLTLLLPGIAQADNGNHCLRRVSPSDSAVSTLCGTPGADGFEDSAVTGSDGPVAAVASFFYPQALALGQAGSVLVVRGMW